MEFGDLGLQKRAVWRARTDVGRSRCCRFSRWGTSRAVRSALPPSRPDHEARDAKRRQRPQLHQSLCLYITAKSY